MTLDDFIATDGKRILARWEAVVATHPSAAGPVRSHEFSRHARQILEAIVVHLGAGPIVEAPSSRSTGLAHVAPDAPETAVETCAVRQTVTSFDIERLASEHRALRATVLSLWMQACWPEVPSFGDLVRFDEASDHALAESIAVLNSHATHSRNLLLGMVCHDLRSPLQSVEMTARYLRQSGASADVGEAAGRLIRSAARMQNLLNDLTDFNRTELGLGIKVAKADVDLGELCADEVDQIRASCPGRAIDLAVSGDCRGCWDSARLQQLLNNLVRNALHYGDSGGTTLVIASGRGSEVELSVANAGAPIDKTLLAYIFEPLRRGWNARSANNDGLGLGLYIASEIAKAHQGVIGVTSEDRQTVFTVSLPRNADAVWKGLAERLEGDRVTAPGAVVAGCVSRRLLI